MGFRSPQLPSPAWSPHASPNRPFPPLAPRPVAGGKTTKKKRSSLAKTATKKKKTTTGGKREKALPRKRVSDAQWKRIRGARLTELFAEFDNVVFDGALSCKLSSAESGRQRLPGRPIIG